MSDGQDQPHEASERAEGARKLNPLRRLWLRGVAWLMELAIILLPRQLNLSWISGSLAVGGAFTRGDVPRLAAAEIGAVVDVRAEAADDPQVLARYGIEWLHLPAPDHDSLTREQLAEGVEWVLARMEAGKKVLVHCQHGVGRSALLASAVLVSLGYTAPTAIEILRSKRWQAAPNDRQLEALLAFEAEYRQRGAGPRQR
ncbi:MAG: dual specificity protein phosphatase family protein [Chloroflexi bacterium]|nr:dual specificity protein phosphatase family protein [Chloroflexota bacterium]